jgi:hypothetical protein
MSVLVQSCWNKHNNTNPYQALIRIAKRNTDGVHRGHQPCPPHMAKSWGLKRSHRNIKRPKPTQEGPNGNKRGCGMATSAGTKGTMKHVFADHFTISRDVTIWVRIINMHLISLVLYAVYFQVFLKNTYPIQDPQTRLPDWAVYAYAIACRRLVSPVV